MTPICRSSLGLQRLFRLVSLAIAFFAAQWTLADEALWGKLRQGGNVILIRHSATEPGVGDPPGFKLEQCASQRNLSAAGRAQAERLGAAVRAQHVPIADVLSSRWCRCLDTARLAFGRVTPWEPLDSIFENPDLETPRAAAVKARIARLPPRSNLVMVSHNVNIAALTGLSVAAGEMVVAAPDGNGGLKVAGRMLIE